MFLSYLDSNHQACERLEQDEEMDFEESPQMLPDCRPLPGRHSPEPVDEKPILL